ncbi:MAG: damage-inducible protein DinB [Chitinophagaceae bacterium]|nr:damage-inducible protein DinB [Chitinophagaceae bacterium]
MHMKKFFRELFEYNHHFNQEVIAVLIKQPNQAPAKCIKLISHMLNTHQIWNNRIQSVPTEPARWDEHSIQQFSEMERYNFEQSMHILDKFDLDEIITYKTGTGAVFHHSVRDLLYQVISHSTYHRGQVATAFRESGLEPLLTDYIYYKMTKSIL